MDLAVGFELILSEARKYKLVLAGLANQYVGQLSQPVRQAVFGNVGTLLTFRLGVQDARLVANEFGAFPEEEIMALEMGQAIARIGGTQSAFNLATYPPPQPEPTTSKKAILKHSRKHYTNRRQTVERTAATKPSQADSVSTDTIRLKKLCDAYVADLTDYFNSGLVDTKLMRAVERNAGVTESGSADFRRKFFDYIAALKVDGKEFQPTSIPAMLKAFQRTIADALNRQSKPSKPSSKYQSAAKKATSETVPKPTSPKKQPEDISPSTIDDDLV